MVIWRCLLCVFSLVTSTLTFRLILVAFSLTEPSHAIIVLAQIDDRYFLDMNAVYTWLFDFVLYRKGNTTPIGAAANQTLLLQRSVNFEGSLDAGDYVVHVRTDRFPVNPVSTPTSELMTF